MKTMMLVIVINGVLVASRLSWGVANVEVNGIDEHVNERRVELRTASFLYVGE